MRWNCPHCDELVTADIDFETTKKAYVRCTNCQGAALIHPTAVLADYVRPQAPIRASESEIISAAPEITPTLHAATPPPPSPAAMMAAAGAMEMNQPATETIHRSIPHTMSPITPRNDSAIAPPVFSYPRPPAFLMKTTEISAAEDAFAANDGGIEISTETTTRKTSPSAIALWIAAALALGSGIYLYSEGKRVLQNSDAGPSTITSLFAQI